MLNYVIHKSAIPPIFVDTGRLRSTRSHQASRAMTRRRICPISSLPEIVPGVVQSSINPGGQEFCPPSCHDIPANINCVPYRGSVMNSPIHLIHRRTSSVPAPIPCGDSSSIAVLVVHLLMVKYVTFHCLQSVLSACFAVLHLLPFHEAWLPCIVQSAK
jgi:hypothetical protein